ncbi:DNA invertase Pin-like site-specific DNA recombinase [Stella humosa]|uniref:DNA invertase Pin-like site-specific DNA recombinase n=1 Tax=Stella humosa TaxID=94 RepID=A0A3N1KKQ3_9PROT|nr:recombinase family protein [Stella humosa]ROP80994.1 DNA invertase Pin-like site-specific DNA recombinase [Stella humosa]BBK29683.1 resolvase [Stella humosa]
MKKIGYLRVSTIEQRPDRQIIGLEPLCDELHIERLSAVSRRRPVYEEVLALLVPGDALVVWDLDRAFRSVIDALTEIDRLRSRGVELQIANLQVDTTSPAGMLVYTVMSAFAEFERRTLAQRTREGLAAARLRGARLGRPPKLDADQLAYANRRLAQADVTITSVAKELGIAPWTLTRSMRREEARNC